MLGLKQNAQYIPVIHIQAVVSIWAIYPFCVHLQTSLSFPKAELVHQL
jgi:hypothetical protein